ncbi:MarC family protein [Amaricoccus tamworthensis]|uniref:MarC family protein n=1 Tax=Amaricoccus tamworthensis TaxID=57002 RepID=UPI003C7995C3
MTIETLLTTFVTLFVIIDPIGLAPLFVSLTRGMDAKSRGSVALRAIGISFFLLALFGIVGEKLLDAIGIGIPAFRISGGMLLFLISVDMLFEKRSERREKRSEEALPDPSVFPLAMPLVAGPGALATMILLNSQNTGNIAGQVGVMLTMAAVLLVTYVFFRLGGTIEKLLGHTGIVVVTRLLGMVLAAMSVQFVLNGLTDLGVL